MNLKYKITDVFETEIYFGFYSIYILGGHYVKTNPDFKIEIINIQTNEKINLTKKMLKERDYKFGRKAVKFYTFDIIKYGKFKIVVYNYEDIIVKDSMLEVFPFPFSIPYIIKSFITGKSREKINLKDIEIGII